MAGNLSVGAHGVFQSNVGPPSGDIMEENGVDGIAFSLQDTFVNLDAGGPQLGDALACHQGVGIGGAHHHSADACLDEGFGAGGILSVVTAGLQGDVDGGSLGSGGAAGQGVALRMESAVLLVVALADDGTVLHDDGSHQGIGVHPSYSLAGKADGQPHVFCILCIHIHLLSSRL